MAGLSNAKRIRLGIFKEGESKKRDRWFTPLRGAKLPLHPFPAPKLKTGCAFTGILNGGTGSTPRRRGTKYLDRRTGAKPVRFERGAGGS